ncbi:MAG: hypothetical protein K9L57_08245 [Spirochaetaceae bacterium]|nr:hypothetical protein [Spirochaetia bacterium]MCF7951611.1 hypothetical protein [Spirochaetaceae bacterium]
MWGYLLVLIAILYFLIVSVRSILLGMGKISHPKYKNEENRKRILLKGVITLVATMVGGGMCIYVLIMAFL